MYVSIQNNLHGDPLFLHTVLYTLVICCAHNGLCCGSRALCLFACQTVRRVRTAGPFKAAT